MPTEKIRRLCEIELGRAEYVIANSKHQPTVEYYRGIYSICQNLLNLLDGVQPSRYDEGDLLEWYVAARTAGWHCETFTPTGDHWEHAILTKNGNVAQIDIPGGTLIVVRKDRSIVHEPIPYKRADYRTSNPRS